MGKHTNEEKYTNQKQSLKVYVFQQYLKKEFI